RRKNCCSTPSPGRRRRRRKRPVEPDGDQAQHRERRRTIVISERARAATNGRRLTTPQSVNGAVKAICDIMRRSNCAGALQYVPELTWILFLRILEEQEAKEAERAEAVGAEFGLSLEAPYRWQDWASPPPPKESALKGNS